MLEGVLETILDPPDPRSLFELAAPLDDEPVDDEPDVGDGLDDEPSAKSDNPRGDCDPSTAAVLEAAWTARLPRCRS